VKAREAWLVAFDFARQRRDAIGWLVARQIGRARARAFDEIGEAEAVILQQTIMDRLEPGDAQPLPRRKAQPRARQRRSEAIDLAREVMPLQRREDRRIDADEDDIESVAQKVGKRWQRFHHDAFLH
jgi:hypothetical protein